MAIEAEPRDPRDPVDEEPSPGDDAPEFREPEVSSDDVGGEAPCFAHLVEDARDVRP